MKSAINFVRGAVAKNETIPILTHIHVYSARIQASNGRIVIDTPCPELKGFEFTSPVKTFVLAIDNCPSEPQLSAKDHVLTIKSGKFKVSFPMLPEEYPVVSIDKSESQPISIKLLPVLRKLQPFISQDANQQWSCGIFFNGPNAYATNNVVMATTPCDDIGIINLSSACIDELLRIGNEPIGIIRGENHVVFLYEGGAWLRANTLATNWPDVGRFIPGHVEGFEVDDDFRADFNRVALFTAKDDTVHLNEDGIRTFDGSTEITEYDLPDCYFKATHLSNVLSIAEIIDFSLYPKPCPWIGNNTRGVIIGVDPNRK